MLDRAPALIALLLTACSGGGETPPAQPELAAPAPEVQENVDIDIPMATYAWNPADGDASVPAELGGPGFTGEGWTTRMERHALGDPSAPQGGQMLVGMLSDWPPTLRVAGKDWNDFFNYFTYPIMYQPLLEFDSVTQELVPALATHWQISEDKKTYRFRINPAAEWSDGTPVTSADVIATYKLLLDPTLLDPSAALTYGKMSTPVALSKYIVEVTAKSPDWLNLLNFAARHILPAHQIGDITGADYLDEYQFAYTAVTGPYEVKPEDIDTGNSITITRRTDWWAEDNPVYDGWYNIGSFKFSVVKDPALRFEKIKKGEIDYIQVPKAQWWVEVVPELEPVKRGLLQPRKFFTSAPNGVSGMAINMQRPGLDDVRVRKALQHLYDRETMIEKLYFNEYDPIVSYWPGSVYSNPDNALIGYDEVAAVELLEQAGWTDLNADGYRVKDGKELGFTVAYESPLSERNLTVFQESANRAGIRIELQLLTRATRWKNMRQRKFDLASTAWGAVIFPQPETSWSSALAAQMDNNNVVGFANARVDELVEAYNGAYDMSERRALLSEIDGIIYNEHPYILGWYSANQRVLYWNKFGMPDWGTHRYAEYDNLFHVWWIDEDKVATLAKAKDDPSITMEPGARENRFWRQWADKHESASAGDAAAEKPAE